ncbi:MAG: hypothetical protein QM650_01890 [Microlunatus sp.]
MSFVSNLRSRNTARRNRRTMERAIAEAPSATMREELIAAARRSGMSPRI